MKINPHKKLAQKSLVAVLLVIAIIALIELFIVIDVVKNAIR